MKRVSKFSVFLLLCLIFTAGTASATLMSFSSDRDFIDNANFSKEFGGNVKWGNAQTNGDWEYGVVNEFDTPFVQGDIAWSTTNAIHKYRFSYDAVENSASLLLSAGKEIGPAKVGAGAVNAIAIRASIFEGNTASLNRISISIGGGPSKSLGSLIGDTDAEYLMLIDESLAKGFEIEGVATLASGTGRTAGSRPMYQFKVGTAPNPVPEPATMLLLGTGLLGLAGYGRKKFKK